MVFQSGRFCLIRGLAQILERRSIIETDFAIDPTAARKTVCEESGGFIIIISVKIPK